MPTYEYRCKACGQDLEVVQSFTDDPLTTCESCGGELRKLFGAPGIAFKGSGFYKTDSRGSKKSTTAASSDKGTPDKGTPDKGPSEKSSDNGSSSPKKEPAASASAKSDASS